MIMLQVASATGARAESDLATISVVVAARDEIITRTLELVLRIGSDSCADIRHSLDIRN